MVLAQKIAVVTGAGQGIGRAIALTFARAGAHIVIAEQRGELGVRTAEDVQALGQTALAVETDVSRPDSVAGMVTETLEMFGGMDILVCNAGIQRRYFAHELPPEEFQAMLDVNLLGVFHCCRAVLPTMYARKEGNIIIIASDSAKHGYAYNAAYCASKFGVLGFMEALADEARAHRVRVNAICPAGVKTDMAASTPKADGSHYDTGHFMEPDEIADVALFLASPQSRAIHGQSLNVYGGVDYR